ncbi:MAG: hypothetical protein GW778_04035 [Alphaproteobacteria bacterium]|nr:hypothetical protein [Alphaproteobacteria bacterium]
MKNFFTILITTLLFIAVSESFACEVPSLCIPETLQTAIDTKKPISAEVEDLIQEYKHDASYYDFLTRDYCVLVSDADKGDYYRYLPETKEESDKIDAKIVTLLVEKWEDICIKQH